jgi:hypothetical protein
MHADGVAAEHGFLSFFPQEDGFGAVWLDGRETVGGHGGGGAMTLRAGLLTWDGEPRDLALLDPRICDCCQTGCRRHRRGGGGGLPGAHRGRDPRHPGRALVDGRGSTPAPVHDDGWEIPACPVNGPAVAAAGTEGRGRLVHRGRRTCPGPRCLLRGCGGRWGGPCRWTRARPWAGWTSCCWKTGAPSSSGSRPPTMMRRSWPGGSTPTAGWTRRTLALTRQVRASGFPRMARPGTGSSSPGPSPPPSGEGAPPSGRPGSTWRSPR